MAGHQTVSYWTEDKIDQWRRDQRKVYVSGCGDGRSAYGAAAAEAFGATATGEAGNGSITMRLTFR